MQTRKWIVPIAAFFSVSLGLPLALRFGGSPAGAPAAAANAAASKQTLALYGQTVDLLNRGQDAGALALLDQALDQPLNVSDRDCLSQDTASAAQLIILSRALCARGMQAVRAGDRREALGWVMQVRRLAAQVLAMSSPTLEALMTLRALDTQAGRVEKALAQSAPSPTVYARLLRSETALRAFYNREVMPGVVAARYEREEKIYIAWRSAADETKRAEALEQVEHLMNDSDAQLAAVLLRRYASERSRAQAQASRLLSTVVSGVSRTAATAAARPTAASPVTPI